MINLSADSYKRSSRKVFMIRYLHNYIKKVYCKAMIRNYGDKFFSRKLLCAKVVIRTFNF